MRAGEEARLVVTYSISHELRLLRLDPDECQRWVDFTCHFWHQWSERCTYEGPYRDQVMRSALVLKALPNSPNGAIVAAPTTSVPEDVGGDRNWDYRYTWLRDSSFTLYALFALGYTGEAHAFMQWLQRTTAGRARDLQVLYGVGGERFLPEIVRVVEHVADHWQEPDEGIWEVRGGRQHFVHSKVMAWVACDRGLRLARARNLRCGERRWTELRDEIRRPVDTEGVDEATGAFVQTLGSKTMDASNLLLPLFRFVPAEDPRVAATVREVECLLSREGLVYRYRAGDGLSGDEAPFAIRSFWLVDNLVLIGEIERARTLFERLLGHLNDVGLLGEEIDPATGEQVGNFPQAFRHVGLINSAIQLGRAQGRVTSK